MWKVEKIFEEYIKLETITLLSTFELCNNVTRWPILKIWSTNIFKRCGAGAV